MLYGWIFQQLYSICNSVSLYVYCTKTADKTGLCIETHNVQ